MKRNLLIALFGVAVLVCPVMRAADSLVAGFQKPPHAAKPWVFWFWINGNISKDGITADLEALHSAGVGGVLWMEVSGMSWAPDGPVPGGSPQWHECIQWALRECARLGMEFDLTVDFGYGSGGPHITPDRSMQKLYWSEAELTGGRKVDQVLPRPAVEKKLSAWLRPGASINPKVLEQIERTDSYRDIAVLALPVPATAKARNYRIPEIKIKDGTSWLLPKVRASDAMAPEAATPLAGVVDLTAQMAPDGRLTWDAPPGEWLVLRCGHDSNFKMTRPCPNTAIGLECDRLAPTGIETHYDGFLKRIYTEAGPLAGQVLTHVHVDSWEAGGQNWTATFPAEFRQRRGYDVRPWLPVLTGRVVGNAELSERFLWDMRQTVSELIRDNYSCRLRELSRPFGIKFSNESYGHLCIDNLVYGGASDFPISEFWAVGDGLFPNARGGYEASTKALASVAHTYGKPVVGAESFTSDRGWRDHPFLLKAMGDRKYCEGLNRVIFHLSAHQAYSNMIPGLTHRKWGEHIQRFNTWFPYMQPWMDYLTRCQYLLQQGSFVADVCYFPGEGAPLNVDQIKLDLPTGYDYDHCSSEMVLHLGVQDGRLVLPSGASYRYLLLPNTDRLTVPLAKKIRALADAGARIIGGPRLKGSPSLTDLPRGDAEIETLAAWLWDGQRITTGKPLAEVFAQDKLAPDFDGKDLSYIHRRVGETDVFFVANGQAKDVERLCSFRVNGRRPELWQPETGQIRPAILFEEAGGVTRVPLALGPCGSIFVVFRSGAAAERQVSITQGGKEILRFAQPRPAGNAEEASGAFDFMNGLFRQSGDYSVRTDAGQTRRFSVALPSPQPITGPWQVTFDPKWGGPAKPVTFDKLGDWSKHPDAAIRYYSGTAIYRTAFTYPTARTNQQLFLDLGALEVMARVRLNGQDCGIAWKPPYLLDITRAVRAGGNDLEISAVNLWINRMIGDEQLPLDANWKDFETLLEWPDWFKNGQPRPSGRYTFSSCRHYRKDSPLVPSGLLGPVTLCVAERISGR